MIRPWGGGADLTAGNGSCRVHVKVLWNRQLGKLGFLASFVLRGRIPKGEETRECPDCGRSGQQTVTQNDRRFRNFDFSGMVKNPDFL